MTALATTVTASLAAALRAHWGLQANTIQAIAQGHTNRSYALWVDTVPYVLRVSWLGKTAPQVAREARLLDSLQPPLHLPCLPRPVPTMAGSTWARDAEGHWLHLFHRLPGQPGVTGPAHAMTAMQTLARLHAELGRNPVPPAGPVTWLRRRHAQVATRRAPALPASIATGYAELMDGMGSLLALADRTLPGPAQWLHGDYHAGNLLFSGEALTGILDFDEPGLGAAWLEAAFGAFAFSRDAGCDNSLRIDEARWQRCRQAYAQAGGIRGRCHDRPLLATLFCIDQILIHLQAGQRGCWTPGPDMGFLGCWRHLAETDTLPQAMGGLHTMHASANPR